MKHILVHVHVYYVDMWEELRSYLENLDTLKCSYDLFVTTVSEDEALIKKIRHFHPGTQIRKVANRGYDVGPFIEMLNEVDLSQYSYIIKLHTKRDLPREDVYLRNVCIGGAKWRELLLSFLKPEHLQKCISAFERNPALGMVGHHDLIHRRGWTDKRAWNRAKEMVHEAGLKERNSAYICGTMFICRAGLMQIVKEHLANAEFEIPDRNVICSLSHCVERYLGMIVTAQGYDVQDVYTSEWEQTLHHMHWAGIVAFRKFCRFLYQNRITSKGNHIIKILNIPVYYKTAKKGSS